MAGEADAGTHTDDEGGDRPLAGAALKSALDKERKDRKALEKTVTDLQKRLDDADAAREAAQRAAADANKSEMDKLLERVARVEAERDQERTARESAEQDRQRVERVRRHASEFADAEDVVALLRGRGLLDGIDDDDTAERVLAELKRDKPHLLKRDDLTPSDLEQVLKNGQVRKPGEESNTPRSDPLSWDELQNMTDEEFLRLRQTDPDRYWRSVRADNAGGRPMQAGHAPVHAVR